MARRALAAVAVLGIAAVGLTACSGSKDKASSDNSGNKTLVVTYYKTSSFAQMDELMKRVKGEFEEAHKGVTIDLQPVEAEADQYFTKLALMNKSKSKAPDIIYEDTFQVMSDAAAGYLMPIDQYVKNWDEWSQSPESSIPGAKGRDGKLYGVPFGTDTRGIYFNKKIFEQAGLPTDWQPKNWDEILSAARTIKEKVPGVIPMNIYAGRAGGEQTTMQGFEMLLYGTQDTLYNTDTNKWISGSQGFKDALTFYQTAYSEGLAPSNDIALDKGVGPRMVTEFMPQGKVAINIDGSWLPSSWMREETKWADWQDTIGLAKMPTQKGQEPGFTTLSGGWVLSVGSQTKDPELAADFVKTALNKKGSLEYSITTSAVAIRKDIVSDQDYLKSNPSFKFFADLVQYTHFRPATPDYPQISTNIQTATESVVTKEQTPEQAAKAYDEGLVKIVGEKNIEAAK